MEAEEKRGINEEISDTLCNLAAEARELYLDRAVPVLDDVPSPLVFHREYVSPNKPVVIKGAVNSWPALAKWSPQYFREKVGSLSVSVTVTPNGYADAVRGDYFVMPEERTMKFAEFLDILEKPEKTNGIFYIQKQNSNFTEEFKDIIHDADTELPWATETFGKIPDAVNFWMGDERAVTSMHRDHYENLYCVVSGWKRFLLIPPTDLPFIPYEEYPCANYRESRDGLFLIEEDETLGKVPWIAVDPLSPDLKRYPQFSQAKVYDVTVHAGETLYLPSLWYHHVRQSHGCIAVNFWYDMEFDIKYNYYKFLEKIVNLIPKKKEENEENDQSRPS